MDAALTTLIEQRNTLRAERAELIQQMNDWELAGRDITELEVEYETLMTELKAVNAEINTYRI